MVMIKDGVVVNFIHILPEQAPEFENKTTQIIDGANVPVQIGDEYREGQFYRDGILVEPDPDPTDQLQERLSDAEQALAIVFGEAD